MLSTPFIPRTSSIIFLAAFALPALAQTCWYPDGLNQAQSDVPCNSDGSTSACCGANAFCLDNGLCFGNGVVSRGSCTDKNWGPDCPQYCLTGDAASVGWPLQPCNPVEGLFTCGTSNTNCVNGDDSFTMNEGNQIVLRSTQVAALEAGKAKTMTLSPTTIFSAPADSNSSGFSSDGKFSALEMTGVGVGVGVPLLLCLVCTTIMVFSQKRRLRDVHAARVDEKFSNETPPQTAIPAYMRQLLPQTPTAPYQSRGYQSHQQMENGSYFHEVSLNELDGHTDPQELDLSKPRQW